MFFAIIINAGKIDITIKNIPVFTTLFLFIMVDYLVRYDNNCANNKK